MTGGGGGSKAVDGSSPIPAHMLIEVVYNTSLRTTTRATHRDLLMEGLRLSTLKQDGHDSLRDLSHWSIIPYVHGEYCCMWSCSSVELNLHKKVYLLLSSTQPFIAQGWAVTL
jgi:hypothetical protein